MSVDRLSIAGQRSGGGGREPLKNPFQLASSGGSDVMPPSCGTSSLHDESPGSSAEGRPSAATRTYRNVEEFMGGADLGGDSQEMPSATLEGAAVALSQGRFKTVVKMAETSLKESPACKEVHLWRAVKVYSLMMLSEWSRAEEELLVGKQDMVVVAVVKGDSNETSWALLPMMFHDHFKLRTRLVGELDSAAQRNFLQSATSSPASVLEALTEAAEQLRRIPTASSWQEVVVLKSEAVLMVELGDLDEVIRLYRSCLLPRDEDHDGLLVELAGLLLRIGALPEAEDVLAEIRSAEAAARVKALIALAEEDFPTALESLRTSSLLPSPNMEACLQFYLGNIARATTILEETVRRETATMDTLANLSVLYNFKSAAEASTAKRTLLSVVSSTTLSDRFELSALESL